MTYLKEYNSKMLYSLLFIAAVSVICTFLGYLFPIIGGAVFGITVGMILSNTTGIMKHLPKKGVDFTAKKVLQYSIILMGFGFSIQTVIKTGLDSLSVTLVTIFTAFFSMFIFSKLLKTSPKLSNLIGVGTAICGGSAIAAVSPVIRADDQEISYAVSTIFLFNVLAVFIFPFFGHLMNMDQLSFGLWAGTAINDTSSVVAAAYSYGDVAGDHATVVKLTRATLIVPIALIYAGIEIYRSRQGSAKVSLVKIFPWFILFFVLAAVFSSIVGLPAEVSQWLKNLSKFMITMALCAIGLKTDFRKILSSGYKPLLLGFLVWLSVSLTALMLI